MSKPASPPPTSPQTPAPSGFGRWLATLVAPLAALFVIAAFFTLRNPKYLSPDSLIAIGEQAALIVIIGIGATLVIIAGGIDLSVGSVMAFSGTLSAVLMLRYGLHPGLAALLGTLSGGLIGFFNGYLTVKTRLHPFIITLGSMMIFRGLAHALTESKSTSLLPAGFTALASGEFPLGGGRELVIPFILMVYILIAGGAAHLMLTRTRMGRYCFAIGSNAEGTRLSGVNVNAWLTLYFVLAGLLFGFAGVVQAARVGIGDPNVAAGRELEAIAAAVIGGTSLSGGQGSIAGTVLGALLMAGLRQGLRLLGLG
ncbi:MAG TPA: ABC transporter permease, partial [Armatimonadota bacterium]|nr:ABC transporter permease [Armatimonadota bacterium]